MVSTKSGKKDGMDILEEVGSSIGLRYGTGGFRGRVDVVRGAFGRCGALAAIRSWSLEGTATGVMVTASHNVEGDNGVKITEKDGRMLDAVYEDLAERVVNANDGVRVLEELQREVCGPITTSKRKAAVVLVGRDTRKSSPELAALVIRGATAMGNVRVIDLGVVTTPELHWSVRQFNSNQSYHGYREAIARSISCLSFLPSLSVDCANGVGATALMEILQSAGWDAKTLTLFNIGEGALNFRCGADFVQKALAVPAGHKQAERSATLDGDADRLVYYRRLSEDSTFELVDGDKILAFIVAHILQQIPPGQFTVGAIHTAYTNGACVEYLQKLGNVDVVCARTGVKHLEREARKYDIGAYWEPNGHGTVIFRNEKVLGRLPATLREPGGIADLANQAVGDGIANLFMIEAILAQTPNGFNTMVDIFHQYPSCNRVVHVKDKSTVCSTPHSEQIRKHLTLKPRVKRSRERTITQTR